MGPKFEPRFPLRNTNKAEPDVIEPEGLTTGEKDEFHSATPLHGSSGEIGAICFMVRF